jgi:hypothetical protein
MKDLTQGRIGRLLVAMAVPIAIGMLFQTLYFLVDLYFVSRLGDAAIAGASTAGTVSFVILALTQMLGVGTVALVSHAAGRKDRAQANLVFNQAVLLSAVCGAHAPVGLARRRCVRPLGRGRCGSGCGGHRLSLLVHPVSRCSLPSSPWARRCAGPASSSRRCSCRC